MEIDARRVDDQFSFLGEVHRDLATDVALHLPHTPFGKVRVENTHTGYKYGIRIAHFGKDLIWNMGTSNLNLATLIGSRICHDLISPIGAIGNGLELMGMRGAADGIEMDLIARSAEQARARIAFYRLAFGLGGDGEIAQREIVPVLDDLMSGSRLSCLWTLPGPCPRSEVRLACLAIMCCETAMPYGGTIEVARDATGWRVRGRATRLLIDPALWSPLAQGRAPDSVVPAQVQFALLPEIARDLGTSLSADWDDGQVSLRF